MSGRIWYDTQFGKFPLFTTVQVQTVSVCNRSCYFCPANKPGYIQPKGFMADALYRGFVDQLAELDFRGKFYPYYLNEGLLDKRLEERIAYAREKLPKAYILVNTNGDGLTIERALCLYEAGMNFLVLNAYDDEDQVLHYQAFAEKTVLESRCRKFFADGWVIHADLGEYQHHGHRKRFIKVMPLYEEPKGYYRKRHNNAGLEGYRPAIDESLKKTCYRPFRQLHVTWRGDVVLCCVDWKHEVCFGNVGKDSLVDIWFSKEMFAYRELLQDKERTAPLCHACDFGGGMYAWTLPQSLANFQNTDALQIARTAHRSGGTAIK